MSETDFDIIVVGSGCAGAVAAYTAASAGKSVLVVERGNFAGAKNMTGGRIYSHSLKEVFPDFESEAPLERKITHERIALMDPASQTAVDFTSPELAEEGKDSYSVLRLSLIHISRARDGISHAPCARVARILRPPCAPAPRGPSARSTSFVTRSSRRPRLATFAPVRVACSLRSPHAVSYTHLKEDRHGFQVDGRAGAYRR